MGIFKNEPAPPALQPAAPATRAVPQAAPPAAPPAPRANEESVLGAGVNIRGDVTFEGSMRLEGKIEGKVVAEGRFTVARGAQLVGDLAASDAIIEGVVRGNVTAADRIAISASGQVMGDIRAPRLIVQDGAKLAGSHDIDSESLSSLPEPRAAAPARPAPAPARAPARAAAAPAKAESGDPLASVL